MDIGKGTLSKCPFFKENMENIENIQKLPPVIQDFYKAFIDKNLYMLYLKGLGRTLIIALLAVVIGIIIGFIIAIIRVSPKEKLITKIIDKIASLYVTIVRGTPVVVQLLIMYFVVFASMKSFLDGIPIAIITFGLNSAAYVSEIIRGGLLGVDKGQMEAGRSLGFTWFQTMKSIILPQGIKAVIPSLFNEFISLVKETSVAGMIAIIDLTKAAQMVISQTMKAFPPYIIIAIMYLVVVLLLQQVQKALERRFGKGDKR